MIRALHKAGLALAVVLAVSGCSESDDVPARQVGGLTAITYNYSDEYIDFVRVNGRLVGSGLERVKPGGVSGGGGACCISLNAYADHLSVEVTPGLEESYVVQATVEQPWPNGANTALVHLLPGRKIVIETTLGAGNAPRKDLMDARLAELGINKEVDTPEWVFNFARNIYTEYMEVPE